LRPTEARGLFTSIFVLLVGFSLIPLFAQGAKYLMHFEVIL